VTDMNAIFVLHVGQGGKTGGTLLEEMAIAGMTYLFAATQASVTALSSVLLNSSINSLSPMAADVAR
jgi:hypothetical protein